MRSICFCEEFTEVNAKAVYYVSMYRVYMNLQYFLGYPFWESLYLCKNVKTYSDIEIFTPRKIFGM